MIGDSVVVFTNSLYSIYYNIFKNLNFVKEFEFKNLNSRFYAERLQ